MANRIQRILQSQNDDQYNDQLRKKLLSLHAKLMRLEQDSQALEICH